MAYNAIFLKEITDSELLQKKIKNHQFDCNCILSRQFAENLGFL